MARAIVGSAETARRFHETLLKTERLPPPRLYEYQQGLLAKLLAHAVASTDFYAVTLRPFLNRNPSIDAKSWQRLPTTSRGLLSARPEAFIAKSLPAQLGEIREIQSGGSTGNPLRLALSDLESLARVVITFRMFSAYDFDLTLPLAMIRRPQFGSERRDRLEFRRWGFPWLDESKLGPRLHLDICTPAGQQLAMIAEHAPLYLNTLPSNMLRLGLEALRRGAKPSIPFIISVAEYLAPETRRLAEESFGGRIIDILSSSEAGVIAIQCPVSDQHHIQSETVLAEIVNANGEPCQPGEVGELIVTPLYSYAIPLIRYRSGDFVTAGWPCKCGRSLPTIAGIVGRREHMFVFPDGRRMMPAIDRVRISKAVGHDKWQLSQCDKRSVVFRSAGPRPSKIDLATIKELIQAAIGDEFELQIASEADVPLTSGGKRHHVTTAQNWQ